MRNPALLAIAGMAILMTTPAPAQVGTVNATLSLYNVVTGRTVPGTAPLPAVLNRVELPPRFTVAVSGPAGAVSAAFFVNGKPARVDNQPPFFLTEDAADKPSAWDAGTGEFALSVKFYAKPDAGGPALGELDRKLTISAEGMSATGADLAGEELDAWLTANLDTVLQRKTFAASNGLTMAYRIFLPPAYSPKVKYPLLVYLHGRGQRGTDNGPAVYRGGLFQGRRSIVSPPMQQAYPAIVIAPQCSNKTTNEEWAKWIGNTPQTPFEGLGKDGSYKLAPEPSDSGRALLELVDALKQEYSVDPKRVYLTGISMGGFGTWEYTARRPDLWAAAIPMAGYSDPAQVDRIKGIPFWIFHGGADRTNPTQGSRNMYALLQKAGADVRYTEFPDTDHNPSFVKAWNEPDLLPWIFSQRRE